MADFSKTELFKRADGSYVTYEDLLRDIYTNTDETRQNIGDVLQQLVGFMKSSDEAVVLMQHLTNLIDSRIKNDDILVKVAAIVSRIIQKTPAKDAGASALITDEEKEQLLREVDDLMNTKKSVVRGKK